MDESLDPTPEQRTILETDVPVQRVIAYAGTGKTTTSRMYTKAHPDRRTLYLVFNSSVQTEAQKTFPGHVDPRTAHSVAYHGIGLDHPGGKHWAGDRNDDHGLAGGLSTKAIKMVIESYDREIDYKTASILRDMTERFFSSTIDKITESHLMDHEMEYLRSESLTPGQAIEYGHQLIDCMMNTDDHRMSMTHDAYLKWYEVQNPDLSGPYDQIIFDEAQDADPIIASIVEDQPIPVIYVGDPNQQIYAWRGAVDMMSKIEADTTNHLTRSFRFGPRLASLCTDLLDHFKPIEKPIRGNTNKTTHIETYRGAYSANPDGEAVLHRTYAECVETARNAIERGESVYWVGDIQDYNLDHLADLHHFRENNYGAIKNNGRLSGYNNFDEYEEIAEIDEDHQKLRNIDLVDEYDDRLVDLIDTIKTQSVSNPDQADYLITTAHRAKGREFEYVTLVDDFPDYTARLNREKESTGRVENILQNRSFLEEINLLYVAMTRAQKRINVPEDVLSFIHSPLEGVETPRERLRSDSIFDRRGDCQSYFEEYRDEVPPTVLKNNSQTRMTLS